MTMRRDDEITRKMQTWRMAADRGDPFAQGVVETLAWVLGMVEGELPQPCRYDGAHDGECLPTSPCRLPADDGQ